jgi:hypothetical protein
MTKMNPRFNHRPLNDVALMDMAPSIFAEVADDDRSASYSFAPTLPIIHELRREGFDVVNAFQSRSTSENRMYVKHQVILRPRDNGKIEKVGDTFPEISFTNSHNGSTAIEIGGAVFRVACLNGMTVPENMAERTKVYHKGNVIDEIVAGMYAAVEASKETMDRIKRWGSLELDRDEQVMFANYAHRLRFGITDEHFIKPEQLLEVRRSADNKSDLWTVVNRIQEASIMPLIGSSSTGRARSSRPIVSIDSRKLINEGLMTMGKIIEEIKAPVMV